MSDWPKPMSRKTSEDGVKKSFLFDPGETGRVCPGFTGKPSNAGFSSETGSALTFFDSFFVGW
jgi:hypothetical protein